MWQIKISMAQIYFSSHNASFPLSSSHYDHYCGYRIFFTFPFTSISKTQKPNSKTQNSRKLAGKRKRYLVKQRSVPNIASISAFVSVVELHDGVLIPNRDGRISVRLINISLLKFSP
jgi:hypothetical protein